MQINSLSAYRSFGWVIVLLIVLLVDLGLSLRFGNYWAVIPFPRKKARKQASLEAVWRRPSTILLVLLIGYTVYTGRITRFTEMAIIVLLVLRCWEYDAFTVDDIRESDIDAAHDEVLAADPAPKEEHWDDDADD